MADDKTEAEKLLQQSKEQKRHETEPTQQTDDGLTLEAAVAEAYQEIDDGDRSSNLTLRDSNLAALFHGLESTGQLEAVGEAAADSLGRDDETDTRAAVLRLLVRIGLQDVDESLIESGKQGRRQYIDSQTDEF